MANIPIAKISVEPIEVPIDKLLEMLRPYVICKNCGFWDTVAISAINAPCKNKDVNNKVQSSFQEDNNYFEDSYGCIFWKMRE